jgi:hypothetical protein
MSKNFFLTLKAFPRHYNKYDFTQTHTIHARKEERHNHYDENNLCQIRRSDYGEKMIKISKTDLIFLEEQIYLLGKVPQFTHL